MNLLLIFVIALNAYLLTSANGLTFQDCGSEIGNFTDITIKGCDTTKRACILRRGTNASIGITFEASQRVNKVEALVWGRIAGIDVPFPLPNPDGCSSGVQCPITSRKPQNYTTELPVLKVYPKIPVIVKWELVDENSKVIVCVLIPAQIR